MPLSLHEQLKLFSEAADGIRDDISQAELDELAKDIEANASALWQYHEIVAEDSKRLYARAAELSKAAQQQKNKAERIKEFLKFALKKNGFTKVKFGDVKMSLSESRKAVAKRPASDADFYTMPELCSVSFDWSAKPSLQEWTQYPHLVEPHFEFDVAALKAAGRDDLIEYQVTDRLTVTIARNEPWN